MVPPGGLRNVGTREKLAARDKNLFGIPGATIAIVSNLMTQTPSSILIFTEPWISQLYDNVLGRFLPVPIGQDDLDEQFYEFLVVYHIVGKTL